MTKKIEDRLRSAGEDLRVPDTAAVEDRVREIASRRSVNRRIAAGVIVPGALAGVAFAATFGSSMQAADTPEASSQVAAAVSDPDQHDPPTSELDEPDGSLPAEETPSSEQSAPEHTDFWDIQSAELRGQSITIFPSLDELVADSDLVVVGEYVGLERGRTLEIHADAPPVVFANAKLRVESPGVGPAEVVVEIPVPPSLTESVLAAQENAIDFEAVASAEDDEAVEAAVNQALLEEGLEAAYEESIEAGIERLREALPEGRHLFFLVESGEEGGGIYQLRTPITVFADIDGIAVAPILAGNSGVGAIAETHAEEGTFDNLVARVID